MSGRGLLRFVDGEPTRVSKDTDVILDVVHCAARNRTSCAHEAQRRIKDNVVGLRQMRKRARTAHSLVIREHLARSCQRRLNDNRRVRRLIKTFASWRG
jgi:hypothetical protein